jgi:hypothetical protein
MSLHKKVADQWLRKLAAPAMLRVVMQELDTLQELSDNLTGIEDQVYQTFKAAKKLDPKVKSQFDALTKARQGLKQAQAVGKAVATILQQYPDDKTAQRAAKDAAVMIKRFRKHETEAVKIIKRLSKKGLPPALKKMSASLARMIKSRLVDPKLLKVEAWQKEDSVWDGAAGKLEGVMYVVEFLVDGAGVSLAESSVRTGVFGIQTDTRHDLAVLNNRTKPTTAKKQVELFMDVFRGSPHLKGEGERTEARVAVAQKLYNDLSYEWKRLYRYDTSSEMNPQGTSMEFESRPLDRYDNEGMSEMDHDDAYEAELDRIKPRLTPLLKNPAVRSYYFDAGEKGHLTLYVEMK